MKKLPINFSPTPYSVICGREKACRTAVGNRRLQVLSSLYAEKYLSATTKEEKSDIVSEILSTVQDACPCGRGAFIRAVEGRWWEVDDADAREKIGTVMRNNLSPMYRSSIKSKQERRRWRRSLARKKSDNDRANHGELMRRKRESDDSKSGDTSMTTSFFGLTRTSSLTSCRATS